MLERDLKNNIKVIKSHHIALSNTNSRINLLFGKDYGIKYNFDNPLLTVAKLTLPIIRDRQKTIEKVMHV